MIASSFSAPGLFTAVAILLAAPAAFATTALFPIEATNLTLEEQAAIGAMLAASYSAEAADTVLSPRQTAAAQEGSSGTGETLTRLNASEYLMVSAVRLNNKIVITAARYTQANQLVHSAKMTAQSMDDIEPVSERLAKALVQNKSVEETRTLDNITDKEAELPNRTFVEKVAGMKSSYTLAVGYGTEIAPMMSLGYDLRAEGTYYFLEFGVGVTIPSLAERDEDKLSYGGVYADFGANLYLNHENLSPYVGAGVMPRLASDSITNLAPYVQAGLMFPRESSSRIYADVRIAQNVLPVSSESGPYDAATGTYLDSEDAYPTEIAISIGVGW